MDDASAVSSATPAGTAAPGASGDPVPATVPATTGASVASGGPSPGARTRSGAASEAASAGSGFWRRLVGLAVAVAATGVLGLAAWLEPASGGLGTHEQLNLPTCGWIVIMDLPCPTCGMTTAFAHAADGNLLASLSAQPLGGALALATAMALLLGAYIAATGSRIGGSIAGLWTRGTGWIVAGVVLAAWAYKIAAYKGMLW